jgi:hypothetical protein
MLPSINEIRQAAIGCWQLVTGDKAGEQRFDLSLDGFWRSFRWAYIIAVLDTLDALASHYATVAQEDGSQAGSIVWLMVANAIASLVTFCLFPVIVALLAKPMDLTKRYASYIIGRNWLTVFLSAIVYVIDAANWSGLMSEEMRAVLAIGLAGITLYAGSMIALSFLGTSGSLSFGFALIDFLLTLLIGEAAYQVVA